MIKVDVLASDWVDRTFLQVYVKARDIVEFLQDGSDGFEIFLEGVNEYCRIISIEVYHLAAATGRLVRTACCVAKSSKRCNRSMVRIKSMGKSRSPCQTPLLWLNAGPCCPFRRTLEEVVWKRIETHSRQRGLKPRACSTSR